MGHTDNLPEWCAVLLAAEEWGCAPWQVAGGGEHTTWFFRWAEYRKARNTRDKREASKAAKRRR